MTQLIYPLVAPLFELPWPKPFLSSDSGPQLPSKHAAHSPTPFHKQFLVSLLRTYTFTQGEMGSLDRQINEGIVSNSATSELCELG